MLVYDIEVTPDQLEKLLTQRECATLERKESARELPRKRPLQNPSNRHTGEGRYPGNY